MTAKPEPNISSMLHPEPALLAGAGRTDAIRVLLVEDDSRYREAMADQLSEQGFAVRSFADGESFLASLANPVDADLIVLTWSLPHLSGLCLLHRLRQLGVNLPVVFLTGDSQATSESLAFERGAIDFIDKARGIEVLAWRFRRAVEATRPAPTLSPDRRVVCGRLVLSPDVCRAYWQKVDVGLTVGEYNVVDLLASNAGRYVTYRAIYDRLRREGFVAGRGQNGYRANVRAAVRRIRNKFRECDRDFAEIETYTAFGYCWRKPDAGA